MKRIAKIILSALVALAILFIVTLVGINLYLQSSNVQQRIHAATEQALGIPIVVKRILYLPGSGLILSGLSLPDPTIPNTALAEASKFSIKFRFFPLFQRRFIISQVQLASPHLILRQTEDKKWVLTPPRPTPKSKEEKSETPSRLPSTSAPAFKVELSNFYVYDGSAEIIDYKGAILARVKGLSINGTLTEQYRVDGSLWIDSMEIGERIHPNRLRANFVLENEMFSVTNLKCAVAGGKIRAEFTMVTPRKGTPAFQFRGQVEEISIPKLILEAQGDGQGTSGRLFGRMELRGNPLDVSTLVGGGAFSLEEAHLRPFGIIQHVGTILQIDELQLLKLREARMRYEIHSEKFWINDLKLQTENIIIAGEGPIKFNGKMNLKGRFLINEKIQRKLSMIISDQFTSSTESGYKEVPFTVTGKISHPESDLLQQITGYNFGNLGNLGTLLKGVGELWRNNEIPQKSPEQEVTH